MNNLEFGLMMQKRTKTYAIRVVRMFRCLPRSDEARIFGKQVLRSSSSAAANYRAACRAKSRPDFVSKVNTAAEEADETLFWLEMLEEAEIVRPQRLLGLKTEGEEILRILSSSLQTAKINNK
jgi:four helix bundle protein